MMKCNLFSLKEQGILHDVVSDRISNLKLYSLTYEDGLKIFLFAEFIFEKYGSMIITTGKFADNILLLDELDFEKEKRKYAQHEGVEISSMPWESYEYFKNGILNDVQCVPKKNEDYYCELRFVFNGRTVCVVALLDEINVLIM